MTPKMTKIRAPGAHAQVPHAFAWLLGLGALGAFCTALVAAPPAID